MEHNSGGPQECVQRNEYIHASISIFHILHSSPAHPKISQDSNVEESKNGRCTLNEIKEYHSKGDIPGLYGS